MFGTFRYILALCVVQSHLWPFAADWTGYYAVFAFYLLSGYLMTMVISEVYGRGSRGVRRFLANRALRIYPPYLAALAAGVLAASLASDGALSLNRALRAPSTAGGWVIQATIFGLNGIRERLVPPAWSLEVEMVFYVLMALGLGRSRRIALFWFAGSAAAAALLLCRGAEFHDRYFPLSAASLPFSAGALLYHVKDSLRGRGGNLLLMAPALFMVHLVAAERLWTDPTVVGIYASLACSFLAVLALASVDANRVPGWMSRVDRLLGSLSYPLFLLHWPAAFLIVSAGLAGKGGPGLFAAGFAAANCGALAVHLGIERPLEALRGRLRRGGREALPAPKVPPAAA